MCNVYYTLVCVIVCNVFTGLMYVIVPNVYYRLICVIVCNVY